MNPKIKKVLKCAGIGALTLIGFLSVMLMGYAAGKRGAEDVLSNIDRQPQTSLARKEAPELGEVGNIADGATIADGWVYAMQGSGGDYSVRFYDANAATECGIVKLPSAGLYYYKVEDGSAWDHLLMRTTPFVSQRVREIWQADLSEEITFGYSAENFTLVDAVGTAGGYFYVNQQDYAAQPWFLFRGSNTDAFKIYLMDTAEAAPKNVIEFPELYNPICMFGEAVTNGFYGQLVGYSDKMAHKFTLSGVFRSNGRVFDEIEIWFMFMAGRGYVDDQGNYATFPDSDGFYYPLTLTYKNTYDNTEVLAWQAKYAMHEGNTYYAQGGYWSSGSYRFLDLLDYSTATGVSAKFPDLDVRGLLEIRTDVYGGANVIGAGAEVWNLFEAAFGGMLPLLGIMVLPGVSLGLLLMLPLVAGVIVLIIKAVSK